ncbi:carbamoyltransferase [Pseudobutyrivibrio sp. UC1225]|uniref:carbamoyltransferase C-terminal domain-containing protein n=1 Tax=Pseudobutyrivibrio sp. UC1225 TaxID=1798185 RepID=UPI0008F35713|nr:carbamoyltransferase C-terminal domain-containing protein [Pseudobutyrivibrio sp. UC1225]SFO34105.1 carbamoyltransferase [Pseudobutyrivibrio sp. UC1225]
MMKKNLYSLGINNSNHDRSAALFKDGKLVYAIAEERLDRRKHSEGFYANNSRGVVVPPLKAINYVLKAEGISIDDLDIVVAGKSINSCKQIIRDYLPIKDKSKIYELQFPFHHYAHAASSFYFCNEKADYVLVADEQGHWIDDYHYEMLTLFENRDNNLVAVDKIFGDYDNISIGMFYDFISFCLGFSDGGLPAAGKTMGLSAYGKGTIYERRFFSLTDNGIIFNFDNLIDFLQVYGILARRINRKDLPVKVGNTTFLVELAKYVNPISWKDERAAMIAYVAQKEIELIIDEYLARKLGNKGNVKLASAGGIFLNTNLNDIIRNKENIEAYFPFPAATDDGCAVGLAYVGAKLLGEKNFFSTSIYLGREYNNKEILDALNNSSLPFKEEETSREVAKNIADGKIVCLFNGAAEFGPRALGNRSILAKPDSITIRDRVNRIVKHREMFRPLAPVVQEEFVSEYFYNRETSPYMMFVSTVKDKRLVGITHTDGTARIQTINKKQNEMLYTILQKYSEYSGFHICINTSFNVNNEPIVESPTDAIKNFVISDADILAIGNYIVDKRDIEQEFILNKREEYFKSDKEALLKIIRWKCLNYEHREAEFYFNILSKNAVFNELTEDEYMEYLSFGVSIYSDLDSNMCREYLDKLLGQCYPKYNYSDYYCLKNEFGEEDYSKEVLKHMREIERIGYIKYLEKRYE